MTEYAEIDYDQCIRATAGAVLVCIGDDEVWIPLSLIDPDDDAGRPDPDIRGGNTCRVETWWAEREGLL